MTDKIIEMERRIAQAMKSTPVADVSMDDWTKHEAEVLSGALSGGPSLGRR